MDSLLGHGIDSAEERGLNILQRLGILDSPPDDTPSFLIAPDFLRAVEEAIGRHGIAPDRRCIEVTERVMLDQPLEAEAAARQLRALGLTLALDDFGAGHASFGYLTSVPVSKVKVDRCLTSTLTGSDPVARKAEAVVGGVIRICHDLGLQVVADGVESAEQLAVLRALGVDSAQGSHLGMPAPPETFLPTPTRDAA